MFGSYTTSRAAREEVARVLRAGTALVDCLRLVGASAEGGAVDFVRGGFLAAGCGCSAGAARFSCERVESSCVQECSNHNFIIS